MKMKLLTAMVLFVSFFLVACEDKIPIKEFSKARGAIELAKSVNAEKYSPAEYKEANDQLVKSHETLIKNDKLEDSVKNSEQSYNKAMDAYNKSAVLYASDSLKKADEAIVAADAVYAEKLSPDNFGKARELYASANEKFEAKDYIAAHNIAEESYKKAVKAKEDCLDNKYQLQVKIDEVHATMAKTEQYDYETYAAAKFNVAKSKTAAAEKSYKSDSLKEGFDAIEVAKMNADEAYKLTMEGVTAKKISEAEGVIGEAEKSEGAKVAEEDLAAAKEALNNSKKLRSSGNYEESITYSNEAIRLGNNVIEEGKKALLAANVKAGGDKDNDADKDKDKDAAKDKDKDKGKKKGGFTEEDADYYYYKVKTWEKNQECLSRIAELYYKNAKAWRRIYKANRGLIKDADLIQPGWVIKIPKSRK